MLAPESLQEPRAILFVDDEATSRKWFARAFGDEFTIVTAGGAGEALALLSQREHEFAVLMTDYRMPERDGMKLLRTVQREHRHGSVARSAGHRRVGRL